MNWSGLGEDTRGVGVGRRRRRNDIIYSTGYKIRKPLTLRGLFFTNERQRGSGPGGRG